MILAVLVVAMLVLLFIRVPVAISMLLPCLVYVVWSPDISLGVALQRCMAQINSFPLLAVPLFVMTGYLSNAGGLADRLFRMLLCLFGKIPGSLGYVNVISSLLFSWMSGAAIADAAGLGSVLVPAMKKRGYDEKFALGLTGEGDPTFVDITIGEELTYELVVTLDEGTYADPSDIEIIEQLRGDKIPPARVSIHAMDEQ